MSATQSRQDPVTIMQNQLPHPVHRALKINELGWQLGHSLVGNQVGAMHLLASQPSLQLWEEISQMQQAVYKRMQEQQDEWLQGMCSIFTEYSEMKKANTLSKLVEQECNMLNQLASLSTSQLTAWVGMMENIQIGYAWWLNQKQNALLDEAEAPEKSAQGELLLEAAS